MPTEFIGERISSRLRAIDKIAYIRFASVYRDFADVGELIEDASGLQEETIVPPEQRRLFEEPAEQGDKGPRNGRDQA